MLSPRMFPFWDNLSVEGRSSSEIFYHVMLLNEARLIVSQNFSNGRDGLDWRAKRLTFEGHKFLEESRKESLWEKAKAIAIEKTGGLSFDVLKVVLAKVVVDSVNG